MSRGGPVPGRTDRYGRLSTRGRTIGTPDSGCGEDSVVEISLRVGDLEEPRGDGSGGINIFSSPIGTGGWYMRGAALSLNGNSGHTNGSANGGDGITGDSDGVGDPYRGPGGRGITLGITTRSTPGPLGKETWGGGGTKVPVTIGGPVPGLTGQSGRLSARVEGDGCIKPPIPVVDAPEFSDDGD